MKCPCLFQNNNVHPYIRSKNRGPGRTPERSSTCKLILSL